MLLWLLPLSAHPPLAAHTPLTVCHGLSSRAPLSKNRPLTQTRVNQLCMQKGQGKPPRPTGCLGNRTNNMQTVHTHVLRTPWRGPVLTMALLADRALVWVGMARVEPATSGFAQLLPALTRAAMSGFYGGVPVSSRLYTLCVAHPPCRGVTGCKAAYRPPLTPAAARVCVRASPCVCARQPVLPAAC